MDSQLIRSREKLERETGGEITLLAWTFGLYDRDLMKRASELGYQAAFTLERRHARHGDDLMALPRYLVADLDRGQRFERLLAGPAFAVPGAYEGQVLDAVTGKPTAAAPVTVESTVKGAGDA